MQQNRLGFIGLIATLALIVVAILPVQHASAAGVPWSDSFAEYGMPATPQMWQPPNWDVQIHTRDSHPGDGIDQHLADHGGDCSAPPAQHSINTWQQVVFVCHSHVMTAISDSGYGEVTLTPDRMADWSAGPTTVSFSLSTMRTSSRDWFTISLSPFNEQLSVPFDFFGTDLEGMPLHYVSLRADMDTVGSGAFTHWKLLREQTGGGDGTDTGDQVDDQGFPFFENITHIPMSASVRTPFEFTFDSTHYLFRVAPSAPVGAGDVIFQGTFAKPLTFTRGVLQFSHHSYNATKCDVFHVTCGPDTWHLSDVGISNAVQYTLLRPTDHQVVNGVTSPVTFGAPAPAGAFLKFMGINTQVSYNGGATFHTPQRAQIDPAYAGSGSQHNYFDPVPAGVSQVIIKGGYARDFSIVSQTLGGSSPPTPTVNPTDTPLPTANPTNTPTFVPSTPTPVTIPLNNTPCTVTLGTGQQTGHCSGTFTP